MQRISIAMATYNGELFIREQLDSILSQTIPFYELIICDDASTDQTWKILSEYAENDQRIKLYRNSHNIGVIKNFEYVLSLCTGEYIATSDQDDIWLPQHLEVLMQSIGDSAVVAGDAEIIDAKGNHSGLKLSYCENVDFIPQDDLKKAYSIFFYRGFYYGASMMMTSDFVRGALPIPEAINNYHDFWLSSLACFWGGIQNTEKVITLYRRHPNAVTGVKYRRNRFRTCIGHLLFKHALPHRAALVSSIQDRLGESLTQDQIEFLKVAEKYFKRQKTIWGRFLNLCFELKHFRTIYCCKQIGFGK